MSWIDGGCSRVAMSSSNSRIAEGLHFALVSSIGGVSTAEDLVECNRQKVRRHSMRIRHLLAKPAPYFR